MNQRLLLSICTVLIVVVSGQDASAQLFGDTILNPNRQRKTSASDLSTSVIDRFLNSDRTSTGFVGAASPGQTPFVGAGNAAQTGTATTTSAVVGLREEAAPPVNVPRTRTAAGIYDPKLTVGFQFQRPNESKQSSAAARPRTIQNYATTRGLSLEVSPDGTTAHLEGSVESPKQRRLAELIVLFEPGIETVVNDLTVESSELR